MTNFDPVAAEAQEKELLVMALVRSNRVSFISLLVAVLAFTAFFFERYTTENKYFTVSPKGQIVRLEALDRAMVTDASARNFVAEVTTSVYSLNYINLKKQLTYLESLFNQKGYEELLAALSPIIESINEHNLYAHALVDGVPVLLKKAVIGGVMRWKFQLRLKVFFEGAGGIKRGQNLIVTIKIKRTDNRVKEKGIEAYSFVASRKK